MKNMILTAFLLFTPLVSIANEVKPVDNTEHLCFYQGKAYSVGTIRMVNKWRGYICTKKDSKAAAPVWEEYDASRLIKDN